MTKSCDISVSYNTSLILSSNKIRMSEKLLAIRGALHIVSIDPLLIPRFSTAFPTPRSAATALRTAL
jgi:hypothetical protein